MSRTGDEIERAIDLAAVHAWERHGAEGMYAKLGIGSVQQLRDHIFDTVWSEQTAGFFGADDREIYFNPMTNAHVILNYRKPGTCLVTRSGAREFDRQFQVEVTRHFEAGFHGAETPTVMLGGIPALHPDSSPSH